MNILESSDGLHKVLSVNLSHLIRSVFKSYIIPQRFHVIRLDLIILHFPGQRSFRRFPPTKKKLNHFLLLKSTKPRWIFHLNFLCLNLWITSYSLRHFWRSIHNWKRERFFFIFEIKSKKLILPFFPKFIIASCFLFKPISSPSLVFSIKLFFVSFLSETLPFFV